MKRLCFLIGLGFLFGSFWNGNTHTSDSSASTTDASTPPAASTAFQQEPVEFPQVLGNAGLIVTGIVSFEGLTPESEREEFVMDALALLIYNPGKTSILSATVTLTRGEEMLYFDLEYLPAGSRVLVVERNRSPYGSGIFDSCQCTAFLPGNFRTEASALEISSENGFLTVRNLSEKPLCSVAICYKAYTPDDGLYVGGRATVLSFGSLQPGEQKRLAAYGYAEPYSHIAAILINP